MKRFILASTTLLSISSAYAVKGFPKINPTEVKNSSCLILSQYENLTEKRGVCSGTLISENKILTAKHCVLSNPERMVMDMHNPTHTLLQIEKIDISCNGKNVDPTQIITHANTDMAIIKIEATEQLTMPIATNLEMEMIKRLEHPTCATFGYGADDNDQMKNFNGVMLADIKAYRFEDIAVVGAIDYDFKAMAMAHGNSMYSNYFMSPEYFPYLFQRYKEAGIELNELKNSLTEFTKKLKYYGLSESSVFDKVQGKKTEKLFKSHFNEIYMKAFSSFLDKELVNKIKQNEPLFSFIVNAKSNTEEKSGMDNGDSGGSFACLLNGQWKIYGVNSMRSDSNLGYVPMPWEPMYYTPVSRITKDGIVIPLENHIQKWIDTI